MTVLILGGTAEARRLADLLVGAGVDVVSSLAGRVVRPALPPGRVRIGGFGGVEGLAESIRSERVCAVVDATHPFAGQMSAHAAAAAQLTGHPLLRLQRPGWGDHPNASTWRWVADADAACRAAEPYRRPFLTTGRRSLAAFLPLAERSVLVRLVDPPDLVLPPAWNLILSRGPYRPDGERTIMLEHAADVVVTKDSGGEHTVAKLDAAAELRLAVVVIERPAAPSGVTCVGSVEEAAAWVLRFPRG